ncbi:MAG: hypothetical protein V4819_03775 [Verrucomicrobiota bacterium]
MNPTIIQSASLHSCEGSSDKVHHAAVVPKDDGYIVTCACAAAGSTLTSGKRAPPPSLKRGGRSAGCTPACTRTIARTGRTQRGASSPPRRSDGPLPEGSATTNSIRPRPPTTVSVADLAGEA